MKNKIVLNDLGDTGRYIDLAEYDNDITITGKYVGDRIVNCRYFDHEPK